MFAVSDAHFCNPPEMMNAVFVPRETMLAKFRQAEAEILARHKLALVGLSLSKAILLAEKIMTGDADLEQFMRVALDNLAEARST